MITRIATGMLAFAAMLAMLSGAATAAEFNPKISGTQGVTIQHKSSPDPELHYVTRRPLAGALGDSVFWIQKSKNSQEFLTTDGTKVFWALIKRTGSSTRTRPAGRSCLRRTRRWR